MKRKLLIALVALALFIPACSEAQRLNNSGNTQGVNPDAIKTEAHTTMFVPSQPLTMEQTIEQYFEQQYLAYIQMKPVDVSALIDMNDTRNRNSQVWLETLIQRRRLITENGFCYVETTKHPYRITYDEKPRDQRMELWKRRGMVSENEVTVHFTIKGEQGTVYPPMMAVNAQHSMRLKQIDGVWKITFHYFPGSTRRFHPTNNLVLPSEDEMLADLKAEFQKPSMSQNPPGINPPAGASPYNADRAVQYAKTYIESRNPAFYSIPDWEGNCSNFVSQCLWFGFAKGTKPNVYSREYMTSAWYAGDGGGSPAWENVESFWSYVTKARGAKDRALHGTVVETISELELGGVIQVRTGRKRIDDEQFNHSLILVDTSKMILAQNSSDCYVYYSDLVNVTSRFFNPKYLIN